MNNKDFFLTWMTLYFKNQSEMNDKPKINMSKLRRKSERDFL